MARKPPYSDEVRAEALSLYREHGPAEAGRRLGIPAKTISSWAARAGVQADAREQVTAAATEAARQSWAERRARLADELGAAAEEFLVAARGAGARTARDYMAALAAAVDKAQLLSGAATERSETIRHDRVDAAVDELLAEMERREREGA